MEPEPRLFELHESRHTESNAPDTYLDWLKITWHSYPSSVRISRRLIPLKHAIILVVILLLLAALCYVIGFCFWRAAVPSAYSTQRSDTITRFLAGWGILTTISLFGIMLKFIFAFIAIICCGKGVEKQI